MSNNNKQQQQPVYAQAQPYVAQPVAYQQVGQQQQQGYQPPQPVQGAYALPPDQQGVVYTQPQTIIYTQGPAPDAGAENLAMILFIVRRRTLRVHGLRTRTHAYTDSRALGARSRYARNRTSYLFRYTL